METYLMFVVFVVFGDVGFFLTRYIRASRQNHSAGEVVGFGIGWPHDELIITNLYLA